MAAPKPSNAGRTLGGRLTRKVGPLPVWAWAATILGAYLLYTRLYGGTSTTTQPAEGPAQSTAGDGSGPVFSSGAGQGPEALSGDLLAALYGTNAATINDLTSAILTRDSIRAADPAAGAPPGSSSQAGPASSPAISTPTSAPQAARPAASAAPGTTQTQSGSLVWDGKVFTTQAGFRAWAKAHGTSVERIFSNHPQAKAIFSTLR